jgi:hypothetical protein
MASYDTVGITYDSAVFYDGFVVPQQKVTRMAKAKLAMDKLNDTQVVDKAIAIKTAMTGNANFLTPNPTLASIGTAITTAQTKIAAYNASVVATQTALADRDAALDALRALLSLLAAYVDNASGGDPTKITSSGMSVRAPNGAIGSLAQVLKLVVDAGENDGTLDVSWSPVRGAVSYVIQLSVDPAVVSSWAFNMVAGRSDATIVDLPSGIKQWVRVRALGANNTPGPWSDPAAKMVP